VFYTSSFRFAGGLVWSSSGFLQPQSDTFALAMGSINGSYGIQAGFDDVQLLPFKRLFLDGEAGFYQYTAYTGYLNGNPAFARENAGSNDSSKYNFVVTHGDDGWGDFTFKYLLPIGGGRDVVINRYVLKDGLLNAGATGGSGWNPLATGRTYLEVAPTYEYMTLLLDGRDQHYDTNGATFSVVYDNSDFPLNPTSGNVSRFDVTRDFGLFNSSNTWTNVSGEFTQYLDLGQSRPFRQQVLALDAWTSYCPTWHETGFGEQRHVETGTPFYTGAMLGGRFRFRGYDDNRFHDRAALYGAAELRLVPTWNPFKKIPLIRDADITWMQWVLFGEVGRVANEYSPDLFSHLKGDVGFGLRILAKDTLVRFDVAASSEGYSVWVEMGQPF
jgi:hypothetical protein